VPTSAEFQSSTAPSPDLALPSSPLDLAHRHRRALRRAGVGLATLAAASFAGIAVLANVTSPTWGWQAVAAAFVGAWAVVVVATLAVASRLAAQVERHVAGTHESLRDRLLESQARAADADREARRRAAEAEARADELRRAVDELRHAQDDLVKTEKLASLGRLVAGVAHEINNPINAVTNTIAPLEELIASLAASPDSATAATASEGQQMLRVIQRGAGRAKVIVQALHVYARGDTETLREVDVVQSIDETVELLGSRLANVRVVKEIRPGVRVSGFGHQIGQLLMNLLTNAAQAIGPRGGTIRIGMSRQGEEAILTVADDGPGIAPDVLPRIFDPFFTTKDVGEGAGMGLSIVHGIVERHGGRIDVTSEVGQGTTFRVALPVYAGFIAALPPPADVA
jgi:signal transduction histidine kinase